MTTIAYKDGVVACDGLSTIGSLIVASRSIKRFDQGGVQFFTSGCPSDYPLMFEAYKSMGGDMFEAEALVVDDGSLFRFGWSDSDKKPFKCPVDKLCPESIGSGSHHALTAMDCGKAAREAVEMAALRNVYTGGTIVEYVVFPELVRGTIPPGVICDCGKTPCGCGKRQEGSE